MTKRDRILTTLVLLCFGSAQALMAQPFPFKGQGQWGYMTETGDTLVQPTYTWAGPYRNGVARVNEGGRVLDSRGELRGGRWGYINEAGKRLTPIHFQQAAPFEGGIARVQRSGAFGYLQADGSYLLKPQFAQASSLHNDQAVVQYNQPNGGSRWVLINRRGKTQFQFEDTPLPNRIRHGLVVTYLTQMGDTLFGAYSLAGQAVVSPQYKAIRLLSDDLIAYQAVAAGSAQGDRWGLMNADGDILAKAIYEDVGALQNQRLRVDRNGMSAFLNEDGRMQILPSYPARDFHNGYAAYRSGDAWGYMKPSGEIAIEAQFQAVSPWMGDYACVQGQNGRWGVIGPGGHYDVAPQYDSLAPLSADRLLYHRKPSDAEDSATPGGYGILTPQGEEVLPAGPYRYELRNGRIQVIESQEHYGYINRAGKFRIEPGYRHARPFREQRAIVQQAQGYGVIDPQGRLLAACRYDTLADYSEGLAAARADSSWLFLKPDGQPAFQGLRFDSVRSFRAGWAPVKHGKRWGYINKQGQFTLKPQFRGAKAFSGNLAPARTSDRWGYIGRNGQFRIPERYTLAEPFHEGIAAISTYGTYGGYINQQGWKVAHEVYHPRGVRPYAGGFALVSQKLQEWFFLDDNGIRRKDWGTFEAAAAFQEGLAPVALSKRSYSYLNKAGQLRLKPIYLGEPLPDGLTLQSYMAQCRFSQGLAPRYKGGRFGYINKTGEWVIPPTFYDARAFRNGLAPAQSTAAHDKIGYYTLNGELLRKPQR